MQKLDDDTDDVDTLVSKVCKQILLEAKSIEKPANYDQDNSKYITNTTLHDIKSVWGMYQSIS